MPIPGQLQSPHRRNEARQRDPQDEEATPTGSRAGARSMRGWFLGGHPLLSTRHDDPFAFQYCSDGCLVTDLAVHQPEKPLEDQSTPRDEPIFTKEPRTSYPKTQGLSGITQLIETERQRARPTHVTSIPDECAIDDEDSEEDDFRRQSVRPPRGLRRRKVVACPPKRYKMTADPSLPQKLGDVIYRPETIYKSEEPDNTDPEALYWFVLENCSHF
ncbi:hypothetical protein F4775DRAFT_590736 [Biscogniauxia sp. FL1348]|nr:hypothetical protein F4775DRAFT_590736 [Biscogniauxia sp. FL1348]